MVVLIAIIISIHISNYPEVGEQFTDFYILGVQGQAGNYPTELSLGQTGEIQLVIVNHERSYTHYSVDVFFNNQLLTTFNYVLLNDNESWEYQITFKANATGMNQPLKFLLYKNNSQKLYRSLLLWINVK